MEQLCLHRLGWIKGTPAWDIQDFFWEPKSGLNSPEGTLKKYVLFSHLRKYKIFFATSLLTHSVWKAFW